MLYFLLLPLNGNINLYFYSIIILKKSQYIIFVLWRISQNIMHGIIYNIVFTWSWKLLIYGLILAGGKGTRLYPLSRSAKPKQFLKVINNKSFLQNTVDRISPLINKKNI